MFHTLIVAGNLGRDPEMRYTPTGTAVTQFSVATTRKWTSSNGEQVQETIWFRVNAWGKLGEICNQYLRKGAKVLIEGRLVPDRETGGPRIWERNDGSPGASFEITAQTVRFLSSAREAGSASPTGAGGDVIEEQDVLPEDDIPF